MGSIEVGTETGGDVQMNPPSEPARRDKGPYEAPSVLPTTLERVWDKRDWKTEVVPLLDMLEPDMSVGLLGELVGLPAGHPPGEVGQALPRVAG